MDDTKITKVLERLKEKLEQVYDHYFDLKTEYDRLHETKETLLAALQRKDERLQDEKLQMQNEINHFRNEAVVMKDEIERVEKKNRNLRKNLKTLREVVNENTGQLLMKIENVEDAERFKRILEGLMEAEK